MIQTGSWFHRGYSANAKLFEDEVWSANADISMAGCNVQENLFSTTDSPLDSYMFMFT